MCNQSSQYDGAALPMPVIEASIALLYQLRLIYYTAVRLFEKHLCNQGSHYEKYSEAVTLAVIQFC